MSIPEQNPMSRTSITIVVVVLLCAGGFAYNQGWLGWSPLSRENTESNKANVSQVAEAQNTNGDPVPATQEASERPATFTK